MIIGVTGPNATGKTEVCRFLESKGYSYFSLSDQIRDEATRRGLDHSRENLIQVGNDMRAKHGEGVWAMKFCEMDLPRLCVVDSIRHPKEVEELKKKCSDGFILFCVDAPVELRYERSVSRGRVGDGVSLSDFRAKEEKEMGTGKNAQQVGEAMKMADVVIDNSGSLDELREKVAEVLTRLAS